MKTRSTFTTKPDDRQSIFRLRFLHVEALIARLGFNTQKTMEIGGRINPLLVDLAKKQSGIEADSALIEFAIANLVVDDAFPEAFTSSRGKVHPEVNLEF